MALALTLGRRSEGRCWPNPAVGCVIVREGRIVGRGWTQPGGRPHAEVVALAEAGAAARGATAYVTLEPCAHHGKTPPCCDALIAAGLARVVAATGDSDPRVAGQGFARLEAAGIAVERAAAPEAGAEAHRGFFRRNAAGRPWLTLKLATSLDGRIATASGHSQWITGPEARRAVHGLRARHDAIMVGAGTARLDDPSLTVRGLGIAHDPVRIVVSRRADIPPQGQLGQTARAVPVWICHGPEAGAAQRSAWEEAGARLVPVPVTQGRVDPAALLRALGQAGLTSIFCEGGGTLAASLLQARVVDEFIGFTGGLAIGAEGRPAIGALGLADLTEATRFRLMESRALGGDVMHRWRAEDG